MRSLASLLTLTALAACTSETIIQKAPTGDPGSEETPGAPSGGEGAACADAAASSVLEASVLGSASVDFAGDTLGLAFVDARGVATVSMLGKGAAQPTVVTWPGAVVYEKYGASYVTTSLAHAGERFGFGWYTERTSGTEAGFWSTRFATVTTAGASTPEEDGNNDKGRSGSDDIVTAIRPQVAGVGDGFIMAWDDMRTKEPRTTGVNLASWRGLYARTFDASGRGASRDVQIAQPTRASGFAAVAAGAEALAIWSVDASDFTTTIHTRVGTSFTPATAPPAVGTFVTYSGSDLVAARGADGTVLVVATRSQNDYKARAGSLTLTATGAARTPYADWPEVGLTHVGVTATDDGFVAAALEQIGDAPNVKHALRVMWLDRAGERVKESRSDVALGAGEEVRPKLAVRASGARVEVALVASAKEPANGPRATRVLRAVACRPQ